MKVLNLFKANNKNIRAMSIGIILVVFSIAGNYMFKVNNRNTRTRYEICSKLTIKTPLNIFHTLF